MDVQFFKEVMVRRSADLVERVPGLVCGALLVSALLFFWCACASYGQGDEGGYNRALSLSYRSLGDVQLERGDISRAGESYGKALEADPADSENLQEICRGDLPFPNSGVRSLKHFLPEFAIIFLKRKSACRIF